MDAWTIGDALEHYLVCNWGKPYFSINDLGHMVVNPSRDPAREIDLKKLVDDLIQRGLSFPILLRFPDLIDARIGEICGAFETASKQYDYAGGYTLAMPVKVNQHRHVIDQVVQSARKYPVGLEVGSKPELLLALAEMEDPHGLIVCNGYKDDVYLETALISQKMGRHIIVVIDQFAGLQRLLAVSKRLDITPRIGVRLKLAARGSGKWSLSAGERSKFGLSARELVQSIAVLKEAGLLSSLDLLHFHLGSQMNNIAAIKNGLRESCRIFVDLCQLGANLKFLDVGGGLAVDYDGSRTNFHSSMNYSVQEYANDVVATLGDACRDAQLPMPTIISESGRACTAHHAVLVFNVLGVNSRGIDQQLTPPKNDAHQLLDLLWETYTSINRKTYQEMYNDLVEYRAEALSLYVHGVLSLEERAYVQELSWACAQKIRGITNELDYVPEDLVGLEKDVSDTYYCNLSVFQSAPDHWAVKQLFPVLPLHRLKERPSRPATIADLTCDSDGKIDQFIQLHDVKDTLLLHPLNDHPYVLGLFLIGAYQEVLGDLHNLYGETTAVQIRLETDGYSLEDVVVGDTVADVLTYMQFDLRRLTDKLRAGAERALRSKKIEIEDVRRLMEQFERGLAGYTYLGDL